MADKEDTKSKLVGPFGPEYGPKSYFSPPPYVPSHVAVIVTQQEYDSLVKRVERLERLLGEKE